MALLRGRRRVGMGEAGCGEGGQEEFRIADLGRTGLIGREGYA